MASTTPDAPVRENGRSAEAFACGYLQDQGLKLVLRNYRSPFGEIDLIMRENDTMIFVEVRQRRSERYGTPAETVDRRKQERVRATAAHYLQRPAPGQERPQSQMPCRFDIVAITGDSHDRRIEWLRDAF